MRPARAWRNGRRALAAVAACARTPTRLGTLWLAACAGASTAGRGGSHAPSCAEHVLALIDFAVIGRARSDRSKMHNEDQIHCQTAISSCLNILSELNLLVRVLTICFACWRRTTLILRFASICALAVFLAASAAAIASASGSWGTGAKKSWIYTRQG